MQNFPIPFAIAIHGGASHSKTPLSPFLKEGKKQGLLEALKVAHHLLSEGKSALDAVQAAVVILENSEYFNAGKGAVLTNEKTVELDAAIMSSTSQAGAVAGVKRTKNPIVLARRVMEKTSHVLLIGEQADRFASEQGLEMVPNNYFIIERRLKEYEETQSPIQPHTLGTVGAVALDQFGTLAAATSTGGLNRKMPGRVGDTPLIGAGTFATKECAVSCTGHGEAFIRKSIASFVSFLVRQGVSLEEATRRAIHEEIASIGSEGGLVALNHLGQFARPYNSFTMSWGYWPGNGEPEVGV